MIFYIIHCLAMKFFQFKIRPEIDKIYIYRYNLKITPITISIYFISFGSQTNPFRNTNHSTKSHSFT